MLTKMAFLLKFALALFAAVTLLAQLASASPAALERRQGASPGENWPPPPDRRCVPDRRRLPRITQPDRRTAWRVGDWQTVRWQMPRDSDRNEPDPRDRRPRCKPWLILYKRRHEEFRPYTLSNDFDLDDGSVDVSIPDVTPDDDYRVIMYLGTMEGGSDMFRIMSEGN